jgi:23S rRNA pseudouridine2604 synthase
MIATSSDYNAVLCLHQIPAMTVPVRLAKYLAATLPCSRREAELYITGGWVMVDGLVVEEPQFMVAEQKIELRPDASLIPQEPATILLHQPADIGANPSAALQLIRAETRVANDPSGIDMLKQHFLRLTPHIPLERNASGMVIYTQDWRAARKLSEDAASLEQEYIVEVAGELPPEGIKLLKHGLTFNGRALPPIKVSWQNETRLRFALKGVIPGQIAHMCKSVGLEVLAMKRIRIGRVAMGKLPLGQWSYLMPQERF